MPLSAEALSALATAGISVLESTHLVNSIFLSVCVFTAFAGAVDNQTPMRRSSGKTFDVCPSY
eukprot:2141966-Prorocentrum_lima.AAC.1